MNDEAQKSPALVLTISSLEDLQRLPPPRLVPSRFRVNLNLPGLSDEQRHRFHERLSRQLAACGCSEGSMAVIAYFFGVTFAFVVGLLPLNSVLVWVVAVAGLLAASLLGKIIGLQLADFRLRKISRELISVLQ